MSIDDVSTPVLDTRGPSPEWRLARLAELHPLDPDRLEDAYAVRLVMSSLIYFNNWQEMYQRLFEGLVGDLIPSSGDE